MSEQIKCVLHNIKKAKMFGQWDAYSVVVTGTRCIFAKLTGDLLKKAAAEANQKGKEDGKELLDRWGDQMAATLRYGDRYLGLSAEAIMQECKDNFAVDNSSLKSISFREKTRRTDAGSAIKQIYGEVASDSTSGKTTYQLEDMSVDDVVYMRAVLGDKIRG